MKKFRVLKKEYSTRTEFVVEQKMLSQWVPMGAFGSEEAANKFLEQVAASPKVTVIKELEI